MEQNGRVLIVDDNAMNVDILRRTLRKYYEVDTAAAGEECLAKLAEFKPQLVLLDIMMPGIDGYETCRRIKSSLLGETLQVILVSGKGTTADRLRGYEALADDYVVKPFDPSEVLSKVRAHFRLRHLRTEAEKHETQEALAKLCGLVTQMSGDISEHTALINEIQQELRTSGPEKPGAMIEAMVRLADTNKATQQRLAAAERKLREQAQEIAAQASDARTDVVTLLPNRRAFDEELARRIAEAARLKYNLCAVMIDLDHFKQVNDEYGHPAGDHLLQEVGRVLQRACRQMDLATRFGGDEFAVLLPRTSLPAACCVAQRIREAIENTIIHFANRAFQVTASFGLAEWLPGDEGLKLVTRSDEALYAAKKAGRNRIHMHDGKATHPVANSDQPPLSAVHHQQEIGNPAASLATA